MPLKLTEAQVQDFRLYRESIELWVRDFQRTLEYVEPLDAHDAVFSHRLYELLLRGATEFESIAKAYMSHAGNPPPGNANIGHYHAALALLDVSSIEVGVLFWRPATRFIRPFAAWADGLAPLPWYSDYNSVKHSRLTEFHRASLVNALTAGAAAFATLNHCFPMGLWPTSGGGSSSASPLYEHRFGQFPFTLRTPPRTV